MKNEVVQVKEELSSVRNEYQDYRSETDNKLEQLRDSFKTSIDSAKYPITQYLEKNKGAKTPMKKTKGYKLLKSIDNDLKNILSQTTNNNSWSEHWRCSLKNIQHSVFGMQLVPASNATQSFKSHNHLKI